MRSDSVVVNAASGQDRLDGARLVGFVLDVHRHGERFADVDALELD